MARRTTWLWAVNANWNDDGWNVEANSVDNPNRWNAGNQVMSRYSFLSPPTKGGVFASKHLRQPPTIFPRLSTSSASTRYCFCSRILHSHVIWRKNRSRSIFCKTFPNRTIFPFPAAYEASLNCSSAVRKSSSIRLPIPKRSSRGMLRRIGSQRV